MKIANSRSSEESDRRTGRGRKDRSGRASRGERIGSKLKRAGVAIKIKKKKRKQWTDGRAKGRAARSSRLKNIQARNATQSPREKKAAGKKHQWRLASYATKKEEEGEKWMEHRVFSRRAALTTNAQGARSRNWGGLRATLGWSGRGVY